MQKFKINIFILLNNNLNKDKKLINIKIS